MAETNTRIEQFKKMAEADPENVLGHFSLGRAYLDSGMNAEAVGAFERALQLDAKLSKAYQLLADALQPCPNLAEPRASILKVLKQLDSALVIEPLQLPCNVILLLLDLHQLSRCLQFSR